jgi:ribosome modulation factor
MFLGKLKPLRGWREFFGELGIIVLGVFIALGADQAVRTFNQRSEMRELRTAIDREIAMGMATYHARVKQSPCADARLAELERWLQGWREGRPDKLIGPISAPRSGPAGTSVWESRDPAVVVQMPLDVKLAYAGIYDAFSNLEVQRLDERMTWLALAEFDGAETLDNGSLMRLQGLITRARWRANNIKSNSEEGKEVASGMGIEPLEVEYFSAEDVAPLCKPILPAAAALQRER